MSLKNIFISLSISFFASNAFCRSQCESLFIFSSVFKNGQNFKLKESMQEIQAALNEVESLVKDHVIRGQVSVEKYQTAMLAAQRLVEISEGYLVGYDSTFAPSRILTKPVEEWDGYLKEYRGMYVALNRLFVQINQSIQENSNLPQNQRDFSGANEAFMTLQRLTPLAHMRF